jgi:hypothetical protein
MPRTHALQSRLGQARPVAVRFTDNQLSSISALANSSGTTPSVLIRAAVEHDLLTRSQPTLSAFWPTYATTLEQLHVAGVRPTVVGLWAAVAHGLVATAPRMQLLVAAADTQRLEAFLETRGARHRTTPVTVGCDPWAIDFISTWGASQPQVQTFRCGRIDVAVATLDELVKNITELPAWAHDDLWALRHGNYRNDDGSRGELAWDYAGRMNASSAYATTRGSAAHFFVDFRHTSKPKPKVTHDERVPA